MRIAAAWLLVVVSVGAAAGQSFPPPALYGSDALNRSMPDRSAVREFRHDRYVGIFYFLWLKIPRVYDNTKILAAHPEARSTIASPLAKRYMPSPASPARTMGTPGR